MGGGSGGGGEGLGGMSGNIFFTFLVPFEMQIKNVNKLLYIEGLS